jgi:predicted transglutaminase-like cysteine proteinase
MPVIIHNNKRVNLPSVRGGFFHNMAHSLTISKLGDLLVASGVISAEQLTAALTEQAKNNEQIGKILIRQGAISAVHLYQKLAQQWCLKASAAGITLMMQTALPVPARADEIGNSAGVSAQFTLAAAPGAAANAIRYPALFGTREVRSNDISAFKKWTEVMNRFEKQMRTASANTPRAQMWKEEMNRLKGLSQREQIEGVNAFFNQITYIEDIDNYGKTDKWATPFEFMERGGDCEDFSIAKYTSLRMLGFSTDQLRVAIVQDKIKDIPHAILIVYSDAGSYVLDNQDKQVETIAAVSRYQPIFSINTRSWWLHKA